MPKEYHLINKICVCGREFAEFAVYENDGEKRRLVRGISKYCIPCTNNMFENQLQPRRLKDMRAKVQNAIAKGLSYRLTIIQNWTQRRFSPGAKM